jgi:hypothetical protein
VLLPRDLFVESVEPRPVEPPPAVRRHVEDGDHQVVQVPSTPLPKRLGNDMLAPVSVAPASAPPVAPYAGPQSAPQSAPQSVPPAAPVSPMGRHAAPYASRPSPRPVVTPLAPAMPQLPVRARGQSLAPELRDNEQPDTDGWSETDPRSSEDVRRTLSSLQAGTRKGREES